MQNNYFLIELKHLKEIAIFPFHLYIYNPVAKSYTPFLYANSPLDKVKIEFIQAIIKKGGDLAVSLSQKITFLQATGYQEKEIPSLNNDNVHELEITQNQKAQALDRDGQFNFGEEFSQALLYDNFSSLIQRARLEVSAFSVKQSPTVSLAIYFSDKLLLEDNFINRIVALSYFLAKTANINDQISLGDLVCGAFLSHIGLTQLDNFFAKTPILKLNDTEYKKYKNHGGLSYHLVRKSGIEISERCKLILFDHHERWDGYGYPNQKKGNYIVPLALIVGFVSHIFEYSNGMIHEDKKTLATIIDDLAKKNLSPGLEFEFGPILYDNLITLIKKENAAA